MNQNKFEEVTLGLLDECKELLLAKGQDYSTDVDKLDNFKQGALFTSCNKWQTLEVLMWKHLSAISKWFKTGRKGLNEPIKHRIRDTINYLILLEAMIVEEEDANKTEGQKSISERLAAGEEDIIPTGENIYEVPHYEYNLFCRIKDGKEVPGAWFIFARWGQEIIRIPGR